MFRTKSVGQFINRMRSMSQSPQIGAMFRTELSSTHTHAVGESQSPQIGAMFRTEEMARLNEAEIQSQSPQIGAMFRTAGLFLL